MPNIVSIVERSSKKTILCIVGPTAVGKTSWAIDIARELNSEILSFDSRQFYREIPIGTAAPSQSEQAGINHHFILDRSIKEALNAADFAHEALAKLEQLHHKHDTLVLVGGSGLYLKALIEGFDDIPEVPAEIRLELKATYESAGIEALQKQLAAADPEYFAQVDQQNPQRLMRALEIIRGTGEKYSSLRQAKKRELPFEVKQVGLNMDRPLLYERINQRVDIMMQSGLLSEVENMLPYRDLNALQTVGYRELFPYFDGQCSLDFALDEVRKNSRRYAKRQLTWFRRDSNIEWFEYEQRDEIFRTLQT